MKLFDKWNRKRLTVKRAKLQAQIDHNEGTKSSTSGTLFGPHTIARKHVEIAVIDAKLDNRPAANVTHLRGVNW